MTSFVYDFKDIRSRMKGDLLPKAEPKVIVPEPPGWWKNPPPPQIPPPLMAICHHCKGSGSNPLTGKACGHCAGQGGVPLAKPAENCYRCNGSGWDGHGIICGRCRGSGVEP